MDFTLELLVTCKIHYTFTVALTQSIIISVLLSKYLIALSDNLIKMN